MTLSFAYLIYSYLFLAESLFLLGLLATGIPFSNYGHLDIKFQWCYVWFRSH